MTKKLIVVHLTLLNSLFGEKVREGERERERREREREREKERGER